MARHTVYIPENTTSQRRTMTAGQWLTEFKVAEPGEDHRRIYRFLDPVSVSTALDERTFATETFKYAGQLFRHLELVAREARVIVGIVSAKWTIGPQGLFALNNALRTPAIRRGGLNIVRHFLENTLGSKARLRGDFDALLSFLEIRPVFRPTPAATRRGLYIMSHVRKDITGRKIRGGKRRPHAKSKK